MRLCTRKEIHYTKKQGEDIILKTIIFYTPTRGSELVSDMKLVSKNIFEKSKGNALTSEDFADFIKNNEISEFYITGADAIACVKSTVFNMCKENYKVTVLSDCITSYDKRKIDEMLNYYEKNGSKIINLRDLLHSK